MVKDAAFTASYGRAKRLKDGFKLEVRPALNTAQIYPTFSSPEIRCVEKQATEIV